MDGNLTTADVQARRVYLGLDKLNQNDYYNCIGRLLRNIPDNYSGPLFLYAYKERGGKPIRNANGKLPLFNPSQKMGKNPLAKVFREWALRAGIGQTNLTGHMGRRTCGTRIASESSGLISAMAQRAGTGHTTEAGFVIYQAPNSEVTAVRAAAPSTGRAGYEPSVSRNHRDHRAAPG